MSPIVKGIVFSLFDVASQLLKTYLAKRSLASKLRKYRKSKSGEK